MRKIYYVYVHRTLDGEIFYVGKGMKNRAWAENNRNPDWHETAKNGFEVELIKENMTEEDALKEEVELINEIGLKNLTNRRVGGYGCRRTTSTKKFKNVALPEHEYNILKSYCEENGLFIGKFVSSLIRQHIHTDTIGPVLKSERST